MTLSGMKWRVRALAYSLVRPLFQLGVRASSHMTGKIRPVAERSGMFVLKHGPAQHAPPPDLWIGYAATAEEFVAAGRTDMDSVMSLLAANGVATPRVALDLGCAAGRMTRHFPCEEGSEIWGADISAPHIHWCQRHLPEMNFVAITTAPHLPFEDGYFDFVFCASVFTHMTHVADAWLLEIRRVLKPGGHVYLTIHDKVGAHAMQTTFADYIAPSAAAQLEILRRDRGALGADCDMFYFDTDPRSQVFYDREYITGKWSRWMDLVAYEECFHNYQAAMLLRKRP